MNTNNAALTTIEEVKLEYKPKLKMTDRPKISCSNDVYELVVDNWEGIQHYESFKILLLNRANRVLGLKTIGVGGISGTVADPRIIFQTALLTNAVGLIVMHNHPSGNKKPSEPDITLTRKLKEAGKVLEIPLLDHVIITSEGYYSFADEGVL